MLLIANGSDIPTMKRKAGKTISTNVIASASAGTCFIQAGMPDTPATSFTKIITRIVMPRKASIERIRWVASALYINNFKLCLKDKAAAIVLHEFIRQYPLIFLQVSYKLRRITRKEFEFLYNTISRQKNTFFLACSYFVITMFGTRRSRKQDG